MPHRYKSHTPGGNKHNIIKFQAWTDSHVNFPYRVRAPLRDVGDVGELSVEETLMSGIAIPLSTSSV